LFRLGEGKSPSFGVRTAEIVDGFYSFLGFTRLMTSAVIGRAVARGIQEGHFGYVSGAKPGVSSDGKYEVAQNKVRFQVVVAEDEIDLDTGFLMLPQGIPKPEAPAGIDTAGVQRGEGAVAGTISPGGQPLPGTAVASQLDTAVELSFSADRNALFAAWNAMANLADLAGKVNLTVRAESEKGFDKAKLQNGVLEPLREADLIE
jgi:hypothetical protein